ncbi:MAG TPA: hypothetical protein VFC44_26845, partial [Candidatus Saccharimonadales bacterium]|nr:hypothetical protein [Candidatus Saccharimonadales bacterium]
GNSFIDYSGCNPDPVKKIGVCCHECDGQFVIPARSLQNGICESLRNGNKRFGHGFLHSIACNIRLQLKVVQ